MCMYVLYQELLSARYVWTDMCQHASDSTQYFASHHASLLQQRILKLNLPLV